MRALVMTGPGDAPLEVRDSLLPSPDHGQVTIDVAYAGVNFADAMVLRGDHAYSAGWPYVPGLEVAGTVRETGPGVHRLVPGEPVTAYTPGGGLAEVAVASQQFTIPVPADADLVQATTVPVTLSTADLLLSDGVRLRAGDRVLVHSASGGLGLALAALARRRGAALVVGTVGSSEKVDIAIGHGYDHAFVRKGAWWEEALATSDGTGYTVVLSPLGTQLLDRDIQLAAPGGKVLRYGNAPGGPHEPLPQLRELNVANVMVGGFSRRALATSAPDRVAEALVAGVAALKDGVTLPVQVSALDDAPALLRRMLEGRTFGKHVVAV